MLRRYSVFMRRHARLIAGSVFVASLILWTASLWFDFLRNFLTKNEVLTLVLIALIVQVTAQLDDLSSSRDLLSTVHQDQDADLDWLRSYVRSRRPAQADLMEYSSFMVHSLLEDLVRQNAIIKLLICRPDRCINDWQRRRIEACILNLRDVIFVDYNRAEVRCYGVPSSVRGRKIDDYLNVGWYFYGHPIYGVQGTATMMTAKIASDEGRQLAAVFEETFDLLWEHPQTQMLDLRSGELRERIVTALDPVKDQSAD